MITFALKLLEAARAGWSAGRAVMDGRSPVLVDDVLAEEACECPRPRVVVVHDERASCGASQRAFLEASTAKVFVSGVEVSWNLIRETLGALAAEADRRDGVRRGPR